MEITMFDDPDWPFSDTVWVITTADADEVRGWFPDRFAPDSVWVGFSNDRAYEEYPVPPGSRAIGCWWD